MTRQTIASRSVGWSVRGEPPLTTIRRVGKIGVIATKMRAIRGHHEFLGADNCRLPRTPITHTTPLLTRRG